MSKRVVVELTPREAAAAAFVMAVALEDEEPSEVRAALIRALAKVRAAVAAVGD